MTRAVVLLAAALAGCAPVATRLEKSAMQPSGVSTVDQEVAEALFRHMIERSGRPISEPIASFCIATGATNATIGDPPPELVRRLASLRPPVKPYSACRFTVDDVRDSASGGYAILFKVSDIACADAAHCTAVGGYVANSQNGKGSRYQLERRDDSWHVTGEQLFVVS